mmetsp:Transcript_13245/g.32381  ORF Transcript_13245/g.32381 Transcript_13245/m.32381 type:complete len:203 (-) Transcript_13245:352-960(-)
MQAQHRRRPPDRHLLDGRLPALAVAAHPTLRGRERLWLHKVAQAGRQRHMTVGVWSGADGSGGPGCIAWVGRPLAVGRLGGWRGCSCQCAHSSCHSRRSTLLLPLPLPHPVLALPLRPWLCVQRQVRGCRLIHGACLRCSRWQPAGRRPLALCPLGTSCWPGVWLAIPACCLVLQRQACSSSAGPSRSWRTRFGRCWRCLGR